MLKYITQYKKQFANFGYLSILQIVNMLLPLISMPYLIHTLGKELYGLTVFGQTIAAYLIVVVNFGFNVSATQQVSKHRDEPEKISEIFSAVLTIKFLLLILACSILVLSILFIDQLAAHAAIYLLFMLLCVGEALFPVWFFQGVEKMRYITIINISVRIAFVLMIFLIVKVPKDIIYVPILQGLGSIIGGLFGIYMLRKLSPIRWITPNLITITKYLKSSYVFFLSNFSAIVKDKSNVMIMGSFISLTAVAYYDLAEKIIWAMRSLFVNLTNAFFPSVARSKNPKSAQLIIRISLVLSILLYCILIITKDQVVMLLGGEQMLLASTLLPIMGLYLIIATLSANIGQLILITNDLQHKFLINTVSTVLFYFVMVGLCYTLGTITLLNLAIIYVATVSFELVHRLLLCKQAKLLGWL